MKNKLIFTATLFFYFVNIQSQITCLPQIGNEFNPIDIGVNFRENANINSKIIYKVTNPNEVYFSCVEDGINNDFVKLKIMFYSDFLEKNGLKKSFIKLYEHFRDSLKYEIDMKDFVESIKSEEKINEYYGTIINQNDSLTIQYWSNYYGEENIFDVTTIDSFKKNYLNLNLKPSSKSIIENYDKIGFINKSQLEYSLNPTIYLYNQFDSEQTLNDLNEYLNIKKEKYCEFNQRELFYRFSNYILALWYEKNYFVAIKEINKYSSNFTLSKYKYPIDFLKMMCSNGDNNHIASINIAKNLINLYKKNLLPNQLMDGLNSVVNGTVSILLVYNFLIDSLISTNSNSIAYQYSLECLKNKKLQYDGYLLNHGVILLNLNKKTEACKILSQEYLNGREEAKKLLEEYCN